MTTTITLAGTAHTPLSVDGYEAAREAGNLVLRIIGTATPARVLRPGTRRSGTLSTLWSTAAAAEAFAQQLVSTTGVCTLADTDWPHLAMTFVPVGRVALQLDDDTREDWHVTFEFQETA